VTTESGTTTSTVAYKSFGEATITGEKNSYTYNGKEEDSTGLHYYGARYYDPETGRFISRDFSPGRLTNPQTLNRYTYCLNNPLKYRDPDGREQAGALLGKGGYPGQGASFESGWMYVHWSHNPRWIGTYQWTGNFFCLFAMVGLVVGTIFIVPVGEAAVAWWGTLPHWEQKAIEWAISFLLSLGASWYLFEKSEDERFTKIEFDWGYWIYDSEIKEYIEGEMWKDGVHQIWVHVPGEGDYGCHWEDDLDEDGVAASVDDDDTNPGVGDEDPDKP